MIRTAGSRAVSTLVAIGFILGCLGCSDPVAEMNVVLVTLDTTRADRLSTYGYARETSPRLTDFAADAVRFDLAIAPSGATPPSHASILTGLNPYRHGVRVIYADSGYRLPAGVPTLATILGGEGRRTGAFLSSFTVSEFYGFDRGFDVFDSGNQPENEREFVRGESGVWHWDLQRNQRRSDATTDRAIEWLNDSGDPFFMWVHYWDPHDAFVIPPRPHFLDFEKREGAGATDAYLLMYDAEIEYMDAQFGRLMDELDRLGLRENTVVVVVGDHGQGLGDHDWYDHNIVYQEQIHVPLIVRVPGTPPGVVEELVRVIDVQPTVLEASGVASPPVEGRSLIGLMNGVTEAPRLAYADAINAYDLNEAVVRARPLDDLLHCAMDREWKLIYRPNHPEESELYRLSSDPGESENLYASDTASEHRDRLMAVLEACDGWVTEPFGEGVDPEVLEKLKSLGYVGH